MLKLYNTLTRKKEEFKPFKGKKVGLYTCGPTVYDYAHIGNLRTYLFEDILKRVLQYDGYKVKHVMNITDVGHLTSDADTGEDKMEKGAQREKKTVWEIAEFYIKAFQQNLKDLNILEPDVWPKATDHIKEQIDWIKKLEEKGFTYQTSDGVYFNTAKFKGYGKLTPQRLEELKEGARVAANPEKKNATDFALWKFSPKNIKRQMEWDSPWGKGFPGWHLECSVMSQKYLGETFDIHTGGVDHMAIHHNNEIAQAEAVTGKPLAHYWLHGEFLLINEGKMAKSEENFITLQTLKEKGFNPLALRLLCLQTHYRSKLNFTWESLQASQNSLKNLYHQVAKLGDGKGNCKEYKEKFRAAINDDLDMPKAMALVFKLLNDPEPPHCAKKATILHFDKVLGLDLDKPEAINFKKSVATTTTPSSTELRNEIEKLMAERDRLRQAGEWQKADEIRKKLKTTGTMVEDRK